MKVKLPAWASVLTKPSRYKIIHGGRGSGKSYTISDMLLLKSLQRRCRILCAREFQNSIQDSVYSLLRSRAEVMEIAEHFDFRENRILVHNGSEFFFRGLRHNVESMKSTASITYAWVEEGQVISRESWEILIPTVREPDSEIWVSLNPKRKSDVIYSEFIDSKRQDGAIVQEVNYTDNPFFPDVLRKEMEWDKQRDYGKYRHVWLGQTLSHSDQQVFKNWRIDNTPPADSNTRIYFGCDFGFAVDPTVLIRCFIKERTIFITHEVYEVGVDIVNLPALFNRIEDSKKWRIVADSARPETISHLQKSGFNIVGAKKGKGSVEEGIERLKSYDIVVHPRCKRTIDELTLYSYKLDRISGEIMPIVEDKNNHVIDALRYATEKKAGSFFVNNKF